LGVVVNYVLTKEAAEESEFNRRRRDMQLRYVIQVEEAYGDMVPVVILPLLPTEVKGIDALNEVVKQLFPKCSTDVLK
jgi:anion-transporting  ArsA/GET3 family ATPase